MSKVKIFCFGFGQVAKEFVNNLLPPFGTSSKYEIYVTTREVRNFKFSDTTIKSFKFDNEFFDNSLIDKLEEANHILVSIPPIDGEDVVIKYFGANLKKLKDCKWITYLSATSVYGNHDGKWVDEKSKTNPTTKSGVRRLKAEKSWFDFSKANKLSLQIFRLSGIYSDEKSFYERYARWERRVKKENHFFSRIHVEDIANVLIKSLKNFKSGEIYNISDDKPASTEEIVNYLANNFEKTTGEKYPWGGELMFRDYKTLEEGTLKDFYKESKKVDNKKMKNFFNYELTRSSFKEAIEIQDNKMHHVNRKWILETFNK